MTETSGLWRAIWREAVIGVQTYFAPVVWVWGVIRHGRQGLRRPVYPVNPLGVRP